MTPKILIIKPVRNIFYGVSGAEPKNVLFFCIIIEN